MIADFSQKRCQQPAEDAPDMVKQQGEMRHCRPRILTPGKIPTQTKNEDELRLSEFIPADLALQKMRKKALWTEENGKSESMGQPEEYKKWEIFG